MAKKVTIEKDMCTLCGLCASIAPDVFEMGEDTAFVKLDPVPEEHAEACQEAVDSCPEGAIKMVDA